MNISDLVGIPYKTHGRGESGLDCFGLILIIARRSGKTIQDVPYKGFDPGHIKLADQLGFKKIDSIETGCIIEMTIDGRLHLGYAVNENEMIHCTINEGVIVETIGKYKVNGYWKF